MNNYNYHVNWAAKLKEARHMTSDRSWEDFPDMKHIGLPN